MFYEFTLKQKTKATTKVHSLLFILRFLRFIRFSFVFKYRNKACVGLYVRKIRFKASIYFVGNLQQVMNNN